MKTSTLAMPAAVVDPVIAYRRQLRPSLAEQIPIVALPEDLRTPEIIKQLESLQQSLDQRGKQIASEREMLETLASDYQRALLADREHAVVLKAKIQVTEDVLTTLSAQSDVDQGEMKKLEAEKEEIRERRQRQAESNRIASEINNRKLRAKEIMDRIIAELPELRDECYRPLRERSQDERLAEVERRRLAKAADQIQGVWREYIHRQLDGSERTPSYDFLDRWTNLPVL